VSHHIKETVSMTSPYLGEIRAFSFNFAPKGWQFCAGQLLPINQNQALFALLGTFYGGNGTSTFGLPDLRGRVALHVSSSTTMGQTLGSEGVSLNSQQIPVHPHQATAAVNGTTGATNIPGPTVVLGSGSSGESPFPTTSFYSTAAPNVALAPLASAGTSVPHENRMPSLVMNYCIAMTGVFPTRS
jgi:microcystin-dependent protein